MTITMYDFETADLPKIKSSSKMETIVKVESYKNATEYKVTEKHFGDIYTTYTTLSNFEKSHDIAGYKGNFIRWPDGGRAETDDYSLTNPDLFFVDGSDEGKGLSDMLAYANSLGQPFSMILPTRRYADDLKACEADLKKFLIKLFAGEFGELPADMTLEIGNETFAMGWEGKTYSSKGSYGQVANTMLETIDEIASSSRYNPDGIEISVAIQSGTNSPRTIIGEIAPQNLDRIDQIVSHHLESNVDAFGFSEIENAHEIWSAVLGRDVEQNLSAWNVGKPVHTFDPKDPFNVSKIDTAELQANSIGARQAGETIEAFTTFIALGADALSLWGTVKHENSYFWHGEHGALEVTSHGGEALSLLSDSLVGKKLLGGSFKDGSWSENHDAKDYQSYTYADKTEQVVFLTAGDIKKSGQTVTVSLQEETAADYVWADVIRTEIPEKFLEFKGTVYERLFEVPVVSRIELAVSDGEISYTFEQDFEVARIIIPTDGKGTSEPAPTEPDEKAGGGTVAPAAKATRSNCDDAGFFGNPAIAAAAGALPDTFTFVEPAKAEPVITEEPVSRVLPGDDPFASAFGSFGAASGASISEEPAIVACPPADEFAFC
ncbi:MAG: hypothetical protein GYB24_18365 [Rhodobacteraceae bacterium]|nr:hypothetical protein [Paracoccaceae bacterium]